MSEFTRARYFYTNECPAYAFWAWTAELDTVASQLSAILTEIRAYERRFMSAVSGEP
jgi:hypothetical protein